MLLFQGIRKAKRQKGVLNLAQRNAECSEISLSLVCRLFLEGVTPRGITGGAGGDVCGEVAFFLCPLSPFLCGPYGVGMPDRL